VTQPPAVFIRFSQRKLRVVRFGVVLKMNCAAFPLNAVCLVIRFPWKNRNIDGYGELLIDC